MTDKSHLDWNPHVNGDYLQWSIPSQCWSGEEYGEDMIKVYYEHDEKCWHAHTEMDQCVKRDLEAEDVDALRAEFGLDRYVRLNFPSAFNF